MTLEDWEWADELNGRVIRAKAILTDLRDTHDPTKQVSNETGRCAYCEYVRHPCGTFATADEALDILRGEA